MTTYKQTQENELVISATGPGGTITLTSLANAAARQSTVVDLGATTALFAEFFSVFVEFEMAATPTAGNSIDIYFAPSPTSTVSVGGVDGTDSAYTGYNSNLNDSLKHLDFVGSHICTADSTTTVQKSFIGRYSPGSRYLSIVIENKSGAAFHSSATNHKIRLIPLVGDGT